MSSPVSTARQLLADGKAEAALEALDAALDADQNDADALAVSGDAFLQLGDVSQAVGHYVLAVHTQPGNDDYKRRFIAAAKDIPFARENPVMEGVMTLCLTSPAVGCAQAQTLWYTLLRSKAAFQPLLRAALQTSWLPFTGNDLAHADLSLLLEPYFLLGLRRIVVCNPECEAFLTALRRFMLEELSAPSRKLMPEAYCALAAALAQYCFNTDFIFNRTGREERAVRLLRREIETGMRDPRKVGLYACYAPLRTLKAADSLLGDPALAPVADVLKAQIADYGELQSRAAQIPSLTDVTDATSLKVRAQYEEFPYPRWHDLPPLPAAAEASALDKTGPDVLIAGCGTGSQPLSFAVRHPAANILAVDISRASLAYAARKADELGVHNVEFRHADILALGTLEKRFDGIASVGVLHHMQDPLAGWRVLAGLLKPEGLMQIGLYSAAARRAITAAREKIRKDKYPDTADGMRRFRKDHPEMLASDPIFDSADYYSLSMYRDLLFHVQEHCFTLPQIKEALAGLGLAFVEMSVTPGALRQYAQFFPDDPAGRNIDNWRKLEEANPSMFKGMYVFWCRRR